ncbi:MAG: catalase [Alphaproteobacteria bacterium]|nr:catalase [Alphaproteobacteria bacterium]
MKAPSTAWTERIAADEADRHAAYARTLVEIQRAKSSKYGPGRTLHRKQLAGARGTLEILDGLPEHARQGLFARPGVHPATVRMSNGAPDRQSDKVPDIRGFAVSVGGVSGPSALGGTTERQDFLLINQTYFLSADSREFMALVPAAARSPLALVGHLFGTYGPLGGFRRLREAFRGLGKPFDGYATERFDTVLPHACGAWAMRVRLTPEGAQAARPKGMSFTDDVRDRLARGPLAWTMELRFFVDEATTPIEDASRDWPEAETPVVPVGRLVLPPQDVASSADATEAHAFDPWAGLAAHRPLGEVMRARKVAYRASQQGRGIA